ncbi:MAG: FecR domain-containing protein [Opitutales bacterium]|jgi:hypothetical protein
MKSFKLYIVALMAMFVCTGFAQAQNSSVGQIKAFIVNGSVQVQGADGKSAPLSRGDLVPVGSTILTGNDGLVLIVFSNGSAMQIKPDSTVQITKFDQAAFDDQGGANSFLRLNADPSKSTTEMNLTKGTLAGQVKQLDLDAGSTFTVDTPAGSAGIRGTIPSITVKTDSNGRVTGVVIACSQGDIVFSPAKIANLPPTLQPGTVDIKEGGQVAIAITTNDSGQVSSITVAGQAYTGADAQAVIDELYTAVNEVRAQDGLPPVTVPTAAPAAPPTTTTTTTTTNNNGKSTVPNTNPSLVSPS